MAGGPRPPLEVIQSWKPNYVDPEERGWGVVILASVLLALVYIVVGLRLWARLKIARNPGVDDLLIVLNMIPLTAIAVGLGLASRNYGFNRHVWDNPVSVLVQSRQITWALELIYIISTSMTKVSILLFYRRLGSGGITRGFLYCVYAAIAFVIGYCISFVLVLLLHCRPLAAYWLQVDPAWAALHHDDYVCVNESTALIVAACISVVQDFLACGLPTVLFWNVQIPRRQKIALGFVFGVGFFICIAGVLRIVYTVPVYFSTYDMTWESHPAWIWFAIEANLAVICASAPALKVYFKKLDTSNLSSSFRTGSKPTRPGASTNRTQGSQDPRGPQRDVLDAVDAKYPTHSKFDNRESSESSEQLTEQYRRAKDPRGADIELGYLRGPQDFDFGVRNPSLGTDGSTNGYSTSYHTGK